MNLKNVMIFGDSYSTFEGYIPEGYKYFYSQKECIETDVRSVSQTWWKHIIDETNSNLILNESDMGSTIGYSGYNDSYDSKLNSFIYRLNKLIESNFFVQNEIDTVFIFGGINDSWCDAPLGELKYEDWKEEDLYFVLPAICYFMKSLKEVLPEKNIVCIINTDLKTEIANGMKIACNYYGIRAIQLANIDKKNGHPTVKGMDEIKKQVLNYLEKSSKIFEKEDVDIINIKDARENNAINIFLKNKNATIYVEEDNKIMGIITLGDLRRHVLNGYELVNRSFSKIYADDKEELKKIFNKSQNIMSVPYINEEGGLVKEYYRVKEEKEYYQLSFDVITDIYKEASLIDASYSKIIFIVDNDYNCIEVRENNGKKIIINERDIDIFYEYLEASDVLIYDLANRYYSLRKIFYDKYKIRPIRISDDTGNLFSEKHISERSKMFGNIAINKSSIELKNIFKNRKVTEIDFNKFKWNTSAECYEYEETLDEEIECIFTLMCWLSKPYVVVNNRSIPVISDKYMDVTYIYYESMMDICNNILPKFDENGIEYILLKYPDDEYNKVESLVNENIYSRKYFKLLEKGELADFIEIPEDFIEKEFFTICKEVMKNGFRQLADQKGKYYNFINGERYTVGNPVDYDNMVFLFGPCMFEGVFVTDENTVASCIRKHLSNKYYIKNMGRRFETQNFIMRKENYRKGDLAIIMVCNEEIFTKRGLKVHSIIEPYKKVNNICEHVLERLSHCDKTLTKIISDEICTILENENCLCLSNDKNIELNNKVVSFGNKDEKIDIPLEMQVWLDKVKGLKKNDAVRAGAIVMNCNPFTLGHRYLIETASKQVDVLYIFVLEEDKSFFKFKDRIELVRQGTRDLGNVVVLPSGRYIVSTDTMPGYFDREKNPYAILDATEDLEIFSKVIAKEFDIKVRFAGEEPIDPYTMQYNEYMRILLPKNGIEFVEISRKECGDSVISASLVRKYLKERNFEKIKELVPDTTYEYLIKNYI